jgi:two-component system, OmpR family, sensor histidine kinase KdpD
MPENLPDVIADAELLTRILTSATAEALQRGPVGVPPTIAAASCAGKVEIRVTDQGPPPCRAAEQTASDSGSPAISPRR